MVNLTEKAITEVKRLITTDAELAEGTSLRLQVVSGGCSGMNYKLGFDNEPAKDNDKVFEVNGIQVIIDPKSHLFLDGTELDFSDGLNGKGFVFNNPQAKKSCGCGNSFST